MEHHTEHSHEHAVTELTQASVAADIHVTISDAARITGASRTRLYRAIESGRLERHDDGKISLQALRHAGFDIKEQPPVTTSPNDNLGYLLTCYTDMTRQLNESLEDQIDALQEQLRFLKEQLRLSQQRETQLWQMLQAGPTVADSQSDGTSPHESTRTHRMARTDERAESASSDEPIATASKPSAAADQLPRLADPDARGNQSSRLFSRWNH